MRSLSARIRCAVESYVESYLESSVEPRWNRRFEYVKVAPLFRYSTVLWALFRDDQVVMQPTMITLPTLPILLLSLLSSSSLFRLKRPFQTKLFFSYHKWSWQTLRCHLCISSHRRQNLHTIIMFTGYSHFTCFIRSSFADIKQNNSLRVCRRNIQNISNYRLEIMKIFYNIQALQTSRYNQNIKNSSSTCDISATSRLSRSASARVNVGERNGYCRARGVWAGPRRRRSNKAIWPRISVPRMTYWGLDA